MNYVELLEESTNAKNEFLNKYTFDEVTKNKKEQQGITDIIRYQKNCYILKSKLYEFYTLDDTLCGKFLNAMCDESFCIDAFSFYINKQANPSKPDIEMILRALHISGVQYVSNSHYQTCMEKAIQRCVKM